MGEFRQTREYTKMEKGGFRMNNFEKLVQNPDALAEFLQTLPILDGPWDKEFQKRFCVDCTCEDCDACQHKDKRNNPGCEGVN